ncbi:hypothetical protein BKA65DRAFT_498824 [Rhexocercosporidium sp. MPI-PUGE-AT-0058]|nr:hypothetical protein BKA65DRAFT_498824 [Rhexocercosporidium sp. MPI-PUGE-AT-0058]
MTSAIPGHGGLYAENIEPPRWTRFVFPVLSDNKLLVCHFELTGLLDTFVLCFVPAPLHFMKLLIFASLLCVDSATRDKLLGLMTGVSQNAFANETGVLKFGLFVPSEEPNDNLLYSIEEYTNQAAFDAHLSSKPVVEILDSNLDMVSMRPELATAKNPYVVVRQMNYQDGKRALALPAWRNVVLESRNETGTLLSGVYTDPAEPKRLFTIDACTSKEYWLDTHLTSKPYVESEKIAKASGNMTEFSFLKMEGGFLYKPER